MYRSLTTALLLSVLPLVAQAQPKVIQAQPRVIQAGAIPAIAVNAAGRSAISLVRNPQVQDELKLTDEQKSKVDAAVKELQTVNQGRFQAIRQLPQAERQKKMKELAAKSGEARKKAVEAIMDALDETQATRLKQIRIQMAGPAALQLEEVQADLELTDDQKSKIGEVIASQRGKQQKVYQDLRNGNLQGNQLAQKIREVRDAIEKEATAVLTEDQQAKFAKLRGEKFELKRGAAGFRVLPGNIKRIQIPGRKIAPAKPADENGSQN